MSKKEKIVNLLDDLESTVVPFFKEAGFIDHYLQNIKNLISNKNFKIHTEKGDFVISLDLTTNRYTLSMNELNKDSKIKLIPLREVYRNGKVKYFNLGISGLKEGEIVDVLKSVYSKLKQI